MNLPSRFFSPLRRAALRRAAVAVLAVVLPAVGRAAPPDLTPDALTLWRWIDARQDNRSASFAIVDKRAGKLFLFDHRRRWVASSAVLLGQAQGDDAPADGGELALSQMKPWEKTTPAGRFETQLGPNLKGETVIWIDYTSGVSLHRVRSVSARERRLQRLASPSAADKRISYGCVNVPADFFDRHIQPVFTQQAALVYVLPETRSVEQQFGFRASAAASASVPAVAPAPRDPQRSYSASRSASSTNTSADAR